DDLLSLEHGLELLEREARPMLVAVARVEPHPADVDLALALAGLVHQVDGARLPFGAPHLLHRDREGAPDRAVVAADIGLEEPGLPPDPDIGGDREHNEDAEDDGDRQVARELHASPLLQSATAPKNTRSKIVDQGQMP